MTGAPNWDPFQDGGAVAVEAAAPSSGPAAFDPFKDAGADPLPDDDFDPFDVKPPEKKPGVVAETGRSFGRGAGQGFYRGVEGASRLLAKFPTTFNQVLLKLGDAQFDENPTAWREEQRRLAASVGVQLPEGWTNDETRAFMRRLMTQHGEAMERYSPISKAGEWYADAAKSTAADVGRALPVSDEFANSLGGQIVEGIGQAVGTLPTYAVPGLGPAHTVGQMYQVGRDDALAKGATEAEANAAGVLNVPAAAVDVIADKLIIGKILKPLRGKITLGRLLKEAGAAAAANGVSEGTQQVWLNHIAANLAGYDPDRPLDDEVIRSIIVGMGVGGPVAGLGSLATNKLAPALAEPEAVPGTPRRSADGAALPALAEVDPTVPESVEHAAARAQAEPTDAAAFVEAFGRSLDPDREALLQREGAEPAESVPPAVSREPVEDAETDARPVHDLEGVFGAEGAAEYRRLLGAWSESEGAGAGDALRQLADMEAGLSPKKRAALDRFLGREPNPEAVQPGRAESRGAGPIRAADVAGRVMGAPDAQVPGNTQQTGDGAKTPEHAAETSGALRLSPWQRMAWGRLAFEGAADVMERTAHPLGRKLSAAMRRHTDLADELVGRLTEPFESLLGKADSLGQRVRAGHPLQTTPAVRRAKREFEAYFRARENQRRWVKSSEGEWRQVEDPENVAELREVRANASPLGSRLIQAWERTAALTGQLSERVGVQVWDSGEKRYRPIGNLGAAFFPRRVRTDVRRVIGDPGSNPELFAQLKRDLMEQGRTEAEAKAILSPGSEDLASSNDYMGNLEKSREGMLPESFYEYSFDPVVKGFIGNYAERLAQIASYGQKTTPDSADLFDLAERHAADSFTRRYVAAAREQAYGRHRDGTLERFMSRAGTFATGALLSNPVSSIRNLISGLYGTAELVGVVRAIDALGKVNEPTLDMDAQQLGALRGNLLDAQFFDDFDTANDKADRILRKGVELGLKAGGYTGAETFIRRHATAAAMQFVTDGVEDYRNNPRSRRALEFLAAAQRLGLDGEKIAAEGLDFRNGMETRAFIRRQVKEGQGGYRFDQVPLWANSPAGRFLYQFGRWGTQRTRALYRSMWVPAIFGTKVKVDGKTERVRNVRPLLLASAGTVFIGSLFAAVADVLFDRERPDASWTEIAERMDDDTAAGLRLLGDRFSNDLVTGGMIGIMGQPVAAGRELSVFNRVRNPMNPPGVQVFGNLMDVFYSAMDEGGLPSARAVFNAAEAQFAGVKNAKEGVLNLAAKLGSEWEAAKRYQAKQDQRLLRNLTWRFAREANIDATRGGFGAAGIVRRSGNAAAFDGIQDALAAGDAPLARQLAEEYLWRATTEDEFKQRLSSLRSAVRSRQPFRVGTHNGEALRLAFYDWARERLPDDQLERILRVDQTYYETALRAGVMLPRPAAEETARRAEVKRVRRKRIQGRALEAKIEAAIGPRLQDRQ